MGGKMAENSAAWENNNNSEVQAQPVYRETAKIKVIGIGGGGSNAVSPSLQRLHPELLCQGARSAQPSKRPVALKCSKWDGWNSDVGQMCMRWDS